jgi:hypothetical protein
VGGREGVLGGVVGAQAPGGGGGGVDGMVGGVQWHGGGVDGVLGGVQWHGGGVDVFGGLQGHGGMDSHVDGGVLQMAHGGVVHDEGGGVQWHGGVLPTAPASESSCTAWVCADPWFAPGPSPTKAAAYTVPVSSSAHVATATARPRLAESYMKSPTQEEWSVPPAVWDVSMPFGGSRSEPRRPDGRKSHYWSKPCPIFGGAVIHDAKSVPWHGGITMSKKKVLAVTLAAAGTVLVGSGIASADAFGSSHLDGFAESPVAVHGDENGLVTINGPLVDARCALPWSNGAVLGVVLVPGSHYAACNTAPVNESSQGHGAPLL